MAHFLLFIPNATGDVAAALKRVGLDTLLRDDDFAPDAQHNAKGPNGLSGMMVSWCPAVVTKAADYPAWEFSQEKHRAIPAPPDPQKHLPAARCWYIDEPARPVAPSDLKRKPADDLAALLPTSNDDSNARKEKLLDLANTFRFPGFDVDLGDGRGVWHVPNQFRLPASFAIDECGQFAQVVRPKFRSAYDRMLWAFEACRAQIAMMWQNEVGESFHDSHSSESRSDSATPADIEAVDAFQFCCDMLALNYRVTPWIAGTLGLFGPDNFWRVMIRSTDTFRINRLLEELRKKKEAICLSGSTSPSGTAAS